MFFYGSAKEDITDKMLTFEQLRIAKSEDFPELEDGKRVTWTMEYGTISKAVPKPKETVIYKLREEIEATKEFLEMLKKQKDKKDALICKVKPRITAQSKGIVSAYKGIFTSMEEAEASDKAIQIVPGRDGKVYEIRCTEAGRFVVPTIDIPELSEVSAGFFPALPRIPFPNGFLLRNRAIASCRATSILLGGKEMDEDAIGRAIDALNMLEMRDLMELLRDKDPDYYYSDILIPDKNTIMDFINAV